MNKLLLSAALSALAVAAYADARPAGWEGLERVYNCDRNAWIDQGGYWNNSTCAGGGNGSRSGDICLRADGCEDAEEPVDPEEPVDGGDGDEPAKDVKPGWGHGDTKHDHSGPPGLIKKA